MTLHIHLVRHGRSALAFPGRWITPGEFRDWIEIYNRTGLAVGSIPPDALIAMMRDEPMIVCSDYPRSIESAARLAPQCEPRISALYREVGRPLQGDWRIRLPLGLWDRFSVLCWKRNWIAADEPVQVARVRAHEAARELMGMAQVSSRVVLIGHGMINAMIGGELLRHGWTGPRRVNDNYWGVVSFHNDQPGD